MATQNPKLPDLWPADIGQETSELGPITLLKSQAALLAKKTKGLVTAEVRGEQNQSGEKFADNFYLVGPTINYQYLLFTLTHPIEFYPAELVAQTGADDATGAVKIENDEQLMDEVRQIFGSEKTKAVISAIIARSK